VRESDLVIPMSAAPPARVRSRPRSTRTAQIRKFIVLQEYGWRHEQDRRGQPEASPLSAVGVSFPREFLELLQP